jgi:hypothetical protein
MTDVRAWRGILDRPALSRQVYPKRSGLGRSILFGHIHVSYGPGCVSTKIRVRLYVGGYWASRYAPMKIERAKRRKA